MKQPPAKRSGASVWSMAATIASSAISSLPLIRNVAQKSSSSVIIGRLQLKTRVQAVKGVSNVCEPLPPDRPLWFPGSSPPPWLDGSLPGDFGFDPLGLGSDPDLLRWFAQAELMHSRWAMLAVAGILIPEWLEQLGFIENFSWYDAGAREYFADPTTLFVVQMALMGWAEARRWADFVKPGCVDIEPKYPNRKNPKPDVGYPGGIWFDPMMWGRGSPEPVMVLRTKEIKNGRLAMLAFMGFWFQAIYTGEGPLENLAAHLADPGHCNIFSVSIQLFSIYPFSGANRDGSMKSTPLIRCTVARWALISNTRLMNDLGGPCFHREIYGVHRDAYVPSMQKAFSSH